MESITDKIPQNFGNIGSLSLNRALSELDPPTPICVDQFTCVAKAIEILQECSIGCALVTDPHGKLCGIYTERDVVQKWIYSGLSDQDTPIKEIMTSDPAALPVNSTIAAALYVMSKGHFRHLPIVDQNQKPVGIVSVKDVMDFIAMEFMRNMFKQG